jgi:HAD superfamily hydrolase (TIGR01509 family)
MKHHIFDLDGVLADSMTKWAGYWEDALREEGVDVPEDLIKIITPLGYKKAAEYVVDAFNLKYTPAELLKWVNDTATKKYETEIELKPFVKEYLTKLKDSGCRLHVLTASPHINTDPCLKRNGVFDMFDNVWSTDDLNLPKSDVEIYHKVATLIGAKMSEITFYDDNILNLKTSVSAGIKTVAIYDETSKTDRKEIESFVDTYAESFKDLL